jgi:hypothetical protein
MAATNTSLAVDEVGAHAITLSASTVDTVTIARDCDQVEVMSDGAAAIYFTVDGSTPTVAGKKAYALPAAVGARQVTVPTSGSTVVKLISSGTPTYSVTAL